ncbi:terpene cyclase/mutase family protein [Planctomicrobium sp. SH664]|uniref:terpene cyclase/mutase family protein n=1 Tax=Planctomicrobium sp. SH664 TaxID=3448125 RepID=UPI003F5B02A6
MSSGENGSGSLLTARRMPAVALPQHSSRTPATQAMEQARDWLLSQQHPDGYWVGELQGDTILESEYVLLLAWLGREQDPVVAECAEYIRQQQIPTGGWAQYPGGPLEISSSVKAYWVLKIAGDDPQAPHMQLAREAILENGGAERVNSFTRYYMALLGLISYGQCPAVPPELILLPKWCPLNIYEMSSWSRTIVVPLSLLWAYQPQRELPEAHRINELFVTSPDQLSVSMPSSAQLDSLRQPTRINWEALFRWIDRAWKGIEWLGLKPLRARAARLCEQWILDRFPESDGLGAIFPPIVWSVIGLRCRGYAEDSPEVQSQLRELEKLMIRERGTTRLEPCKSPVWDTAIAINALRDAGVPEYHPQLVQGIDWLLAKQVTSAGDWSVNHPEVEPGGWYFEFNNEFYPDVDDTIMVTMALARCLPGDDLQEWSDNLLKANSDEASVSVCMAGKTNAPEKFMSHLRQVRPMISAIRRAVRWTMSMQCRDGGWAAFDSDNDREILTRVPFADHNAMIDPPTADITARVLEMLGRLRLKPTLNMQRALDFVWKAQEADSCWYGRWGVNYIYGTWQVIVGLTEFGVPRNDERLQAAAQWLKDKQQANGGWGETPRSYDEPGLRGSGPTTPSQTAWALLGLIAAGEQDSPEVARGIEFLITTQRADGTWDEEEFTGTGFPRVFYLRYHLYRHYFPLMALGRYAASVRTADRG